MMNNNAKIRLLIVSGFATVVFIMGIFIPKELKNDDSSNLYTPTTIHNASRSEQIIPNKQTSQPTAQTQANIAPISNKRTTNKQNTEEETSITSTYTDKIENAIVDSPTTTGEKETFHHDPALKPIAAESQETTP